MSGTLGMARPNNDSSGRLESRQGSGSAEAKAKRVMRDVLRELDLDHRAEAARLFVKGLSHGIVPEGADLAEWLVETVGTEAAARLIVAFVRCPCFYCEKGREACENCGGRGHSRSGAVCERCAGLGVARCDFCDGSGWVTLNYVPEGLQVRVLVDRAHLAIRSIGKQLEQRVPRPSRSAPARSLKECARLLLDLNRAMGVLENSLVAARELAERDRQWKDRLARVARSSIRAGAKGEARILEIIRCMAALARLQAESAARGSADRKLATRRADFYESLLDPAKMLAGTGLAHPLLHEAVGEHLRKARRGENSEKVARREPRRLRGRAKGARGRRGRQ